METVAPSRFPLLIGRLQSTKWAGTDHFLPPPHHRTASTIGQPPCSALFLLARKRNKGCWAPAINRIGVPPLIHLPFTGGVHTLTPVGKEYTPSPQLPNTPGNNCVDLFSWQSPPAFHPCMTSRMSTGEAALSPRLQVKKGFACWILQHEHKRYKIPVLDYPWEPEKTSTCLGPGGLLLPCR